MEAKQETKMPDAGKSGSLFASSPLENEKVPFSARQSKGKLQKLQAMLERTTSKYTMEATSGNFFRVTDTMVGDWVEIPAPLVGECLLQYFHAE